MKGENILLKKYEVPLNVNTIIIPSISKENKDKMARLLRR